MKNDYDKHEHCGQQLAELQDLYNSQQQLTAELSDKLEKTEVII